MHQHFRISVASDEQARLHVARALRAQDSLDGSLVFTSADGQCRIRGVPRGVGCCLEYFRLRAEAGSGAAEADGL